MNDILIPLIITFLVLFFGYNYLKNKQLNSITEQKNNDPSQFKKKRQSITYGNIYILYGSQSGTAIKLANILNEEANLNNFNGQVIDLLNFDWDFFTKNTSLCIFTVATHGEGEPTDNTKEFFKNIKAIQDNKLLNQMKFAVFGLGNTQYEHYNAMGKLLNNELERLGGLRVYKYGEGDDNSSLEDDFNEWKSNIWEELKKINVMIKQENFIENEDKEIRLVEKKKEGNNQQLKNIEKLKYQFQTEAYINSKECYIQEIQEIRQNNEEGSTFHIKIKNSEGKMNYKTAQNVGVFPKNDPFLVSEVCHYLNLDENQIWVWEGELEDKIKLPFPSNISTREILETFCDFQGQVMKKTLKDLAKIYRKQHQQNENLSQKIEFLAGIQGKNEFQKEIFEEKKGIFQILKDFNIKVGFWEFVQLCQRINPRLFTVSSSSVKFDNQLHITASLINDQVSWGLKEGLCSNYFKNLKNQLDNQGSLPNIKIDFRDSNFKLPENRKNNVIMVGAGTGVAPFIGFCQEKECLQDQFGKFTLFFGCRKADSDFIFKNQINEFINKGVLDKFYAAFSRDQKNKIYVQDKILENQDIVYEDIFQNNAVIYICGSTYMGNAVINILKKIISNKQQINDQEAQQKIKQLESSSKIIKELW